MAPVRKKGGRAASAAASKLVWNTGDLVVAKVKGHPWWPAKIDEPEEHGYSKDRKKVFVVFFGTQQIAYVQPTAVKSFTLETKKGLLAKAKRKSSTTDFCRAVKEICAEGEGLTISDSDDSQEETEEEDVNETNPKFADFEETDSRKDNDISASKRIETKQDNLRNGSISRNEKSGAVQNRVIHQVHKKRRKIIVSDEDSDSNEDLNNAKSTSPSRTPDHADFNDLSGQTMHEKNKLMSQDQTHTERETYNSSKGQRTPTMDRSKLDTDDDDKEAEEMLQESLLPNKKRRASRKLDHESISIESEKLFDSVDLPPFELGIRGLVTEYQRKKKVPDTGQAQSVSQKSGSAIKEREQAAASALDDNKESTPVKAYKRQKTTEETNDPHETLKDRKDYHLSRGSVDDNKDGPASKRGDSSVRVEAKGEMQSIANEQNGTTLSGNAKQVTKSRFLADKDTVLPPKADKYRIRSSIADGEAALPPSKRRQRAFEAMSACAAEAAETVEKPHEDAKATGKDIKMKDVEGKILSECSPIKKNQEPDSGSDHQHTMAASETKSNVSPGVAVHKVDNEPCLQSPKKSDGGKSKHLKAGNQNKATDLSKVSTEKSVMKSKIKASKSISGSDDQNVKHSKQDEHHPDQCARHGKHDQNQDSSTKPANSSLKHSKPAAAAKIPSEMKATGLKEMMKNTSTVMRARLETLSVSKLQTDSYSNKVREAVEAAKEAQQKVKEALQKQMAASSYPVSKVSDADRSTTNFVHSPSPGKSTLLSSPVHSRAIFSTAQDSVDMAHTPKGAVASVVVTPGVSGEEVRVTPGQNLSSREEVLSGDPEVSVARDTFGGMLETLSRTKESIARATRHALDCAKFGIADQVIEIILQRIENEQNFHRRIDLFFLVDSIMQLSASTPGLAGAAYRSSVQAALSRLVHAAAPPGSGARENRRQCLRVLKLWSSRKVMPESVLRTFVTELESHNDDKLIGVSLRRPARFERAVDDPIREMEGMLVDEYGSNATFGLTGLLSSQIFDDDEESLGPTNEVDILKCAQDIKEASDAYHLQSEKHRHILEDVEGELEMEDASPEGSVNDASQQDTTLPPPPPPDFPPPSPPPLPSSPPPLPSSPPPPPPLSPPPLSPGSPHADSFLSSKYAPAYGSSSFGSTNRSKHSPVMASEVGSVYSVSNEEQASVPIVSRKVRVSTGEDSIYDHSAHKFSGQHPSPRKAQALNRESAYASPPKGYITTHTSQSFTTHTPNSITQHVSIGSQGQYGRLPSPPPSQPRLVSYGRSKALHRSSSPSFQRDPSYAHLRRGEREYQRDVYRDRYGDEKYSSMVAGADETSHSRSRMYSSHESRSRLSYNCAPNTQSQGSSSQPALGIPASLASNIDIADALNSGNGGRGGLTHYDTVNQTKVQVMARHRGSASKWRPN